MWAIGGCPTHGSLSWQNGSPILTLFRNVLEGNSLIQKIEDSDDPVLVATRLPNRPTITASVPGFGTITLKDCFCSGWASQQSIDLKSSTWNLKIHPQSIWIGSPPSDLDGQIIRIEVSDTRLAGLFGTSDLKTFRSDFGDEKAAFESLDHPKNIWAIYGNSQAAIPLGDTGFGLRISTSAGEDWSATRGITLRSGTTLNLATDEPRTITDAFDIVYELEKMISIFCLEPFEFEAIVFANDVNSTVKVWHLGSGTDTFKPPMRHQLLINFAKHEVISSLCENWFKQTKTVELSRWLFTQALRESKGGAAQFLAVSQAFEVLGREFGPTKKMDKIQLSDAVETIKLTLGEKNFEPEFIDRIGQLIKSSNRSSYRDILEHMLHDVYGQVQNYFGQQLSEFTKDVSDTRNVVVHMSSDDEARLHAAFGKVNKLNLKLCAVYAILQAYQLSLPVENIGRFMFNNRNARHGLPNDLLEVR